MDVVTDQTAAHDPLNGYVPSGLSLENAATLRKNNPEEYQRQSLQSMARHVEAILEFKKRGASSLSMVITYVSLPKKEEHRTPSQFQDSFPSTSDHFFAKARDLSVGRLYREILRIFTAPTKP